MAVFMGASATDAFGETLVTFGDVVSLP
jgi:hypothetical protein